MANPFAFRPGPVTFWTTLIYLAVVVPLLVVHETVPPHGAERGLDLGEAWADLQTVTRAYHPYNSHDNDRVRSFILGRVKDILERNGVDYTVDTGGGEARRRAEPGVTVFDDGVSNVTFTAGGAPPVGRYFEGSNVYVYIHGRDDAGDDASGVLVNCHFDSVSTGFGATDDGMACVSMLQLLNYFTSGGRRPRNGIVLLFNNAEEDGLLGATAFGRSPLLRFCHAFVNLEGAGAGGRAMLFRTTDLEAARAYGGAPHPFGSVVAADAFRRGVIKSATDYQIFAGIYGQRGLDIAFYEPRARYHTQQDDARHASVDSLWHMLSAALASTKALSESTDFRGPRADGRDDVVQNGAPTTGVWFDLFGSAWVAFPLHGLVAWSVSLLVATPLLVALVTYLLARRSKHCYATGLRGWRGFFRYPLALVFASALTAGSALVVAKFNPLIVASSGYAVWAMTLSLFYFSFWLVARGASVVRPTPLQRGFAFFWLFALTWALQIAAAVAEDHGVGGLYFAAFLHTAVFACLLISLLEQLGGSPEVDAVESGDAEAEAETETDAEANRPAQADASETTPLVQGTFANTYRRPVAAPRSSPRGPSWTWFLQLLLLAPVHLMLLGNLALVETTATQMTGPDGSSLVGPLVAIAGLSVLLVLPLTPFIHRATHHVPVFLLLVFVATLVYNLVAFPFSPNKRFKLRFQQTIDLDDGTNVVSLLGLEQFVRPVAAALPGRPRIACSDADALVDCTYASRLAPDPAGEPLDGLVSASATRAAGGIALRIRARNTRLCHVDLARPVAGFAVEGAAPHDGRFGALPPDGLARLQLWRRAWDGAWNVTLRTDADPGITVRCAWDDANGPAIPALGELMQYMPSWAAVTKRTSGLVQVKRTVSVE